VPHQVRVLRPQTRPVSLFLMAICVCGCFTLATVHVSAVTHHIANTTSIMAPHTHTHTHTHTHVRTHGYVESNTITPSSARLRVFSAGSSTECRQTHCHCLAGCHTLCVFQKYADRVCKREKRRKGSRDRETQREKREGQRHTRGRHESQVSMHVS
jgi:hypothetical protein